MKYPDKGVLLDILKGSVATLALFLAYVSLPLAGILPGLFAPLPGMYYALKSGKGVGIAIVLVTTAVLATIADPTLLVVYVAQSGLISLVLPHLLRRGWGTPRTIFGSVAVACAFLLVVACFLWVVRGIDLHGAILKGINSSISQTALIYEKGGVKGEELQTLQQAVKEAGTLIGMIYPALLLIGLATVAGFNLLALRRLAATKLGQALPVGDFRKFRNPDHLIWLVIAAGFSLLIKNDAVFTIALNILVATLALYFLQGFAIIIHMFERFTVPRFIRVIFYVLLGLQPYLVAAVAVLGIFDLWGNFRTPKKHENL